MTMLKALTIGYDYARTEGLSSLWSKDINANASIDGATPNSGFKTRHSWTLRQKGRFPGTNTTKGNLWVS